MEKNPCVNAKELWTNVTWSGVIQPGGSLTRSMAQFFQICGSTTTGMVAPPHRDMHLLVKSLESKYSPPVEINGDVLVMFGNGVTLDTPDLNDPGHLSGSAANRLLTAARLYYITKLPIILSGGRVFKENGNESQIAKRQLIGLGIPEQKIIIEDKSRNTAENALYTGNILEKSAYQKPVLIVSAFQMHRTVLNFKKLGVEVIPYPTDYRSNINWYFDVFHLVPSAASLSNTSLIIKEYLGILALSF